MKWFEKNWWRVAIVYVVIGLLTFGNSYNDSLNCGPPPNILDDYDGYRAYRDLDTKGVSDSGREYRVYGFTSAHVADTRLQDALEDLFKTIGDENE